MNLLGKLSTLFGQSSTNAASSATASRSVARERLSVILASQRGSEILDNVDMAKFQNDVMEVVRVRILQTLLTNLHFSATPVISILVFFLICPAHFYAFAKIFRGTLSLPKMNQSVFKLSKREMLIYLKCKLN